jgi:hypothetical protein
VEYSPRAVNFDLSLADQIPLIAWYPQSLIGQEYAQNDVSSGIDSMLVPPSIFAFQVV